MNRADKSALRFEAEAKQAVHSSDLPKAAYFLTLAIGAANYDVLQYMNAIRFATKSRSISVIERLTDHFIRHLISINGTTSLLETYSVLLDWIGIERFLKISIKACYKEALYNIDTLRKFRDGVTHDCIWDAIIAFVMHPERRFLGDLLTVSNASYDIVLDSIVETLAEKLKEKRLAASVDSTIRTPQRILIVTNSLAMGGNEKNATTMAKFFADHNVMDQVIIAFGDRNIRENHFGSELYDANCRVVDIFSEPMDVRGDVSKVLRSVIPGAALTKIDFDAVNAIFGILQSHAIDAVHSFASDARNVEVFLACLFAEVRFVSLNPGSMAPTTRGRYVEDQRSLISKAVYRACAELRGYSIFCCSMTAALDYCKWIKLPPGSVRTNYVGVRTDFKRPRRREKSDKIVVGGAFRFEEVKDPVLWTEVAVSACKMFDGIEFSVAGDGLLLEKCQEIVDANGLTSRVIFRGALDDMEAFYHSVDIFLHCSRSEGLGNVLIEAQAAGVPVVAPPVGGIPETIVHMRSGIVACSRNSADLLSALCSLINNRELLDSMSHFAPFFVAKRFGEKQMYNDMISAWSWVDE